MEKDIIEEFLKGDTSYAKDIVIIRIPKENDTEEHKLSCMGVERWLKTMGAEIITPETMPKTRKDIKKLINKGNGANE